MSKLHLNLTESATRAAILSQAEAAMNEQQRETYQDAVKKLSVPDEHHHHLSDVLIAIEALDAPEQVKLDMKGVYRILAEAEATVHETPIDHTHFHEVGNGSAILNTAKICTALWALSPDAVSCTHVQTGEGKVMCAHGELDIPAPATQAILSRGVPTCDEKLPGELCTPTSAAIIFHFVTEFEE